MTRKSHSSKVFTFEANGNQYTWSVMNGFEYQNGDLVYLTGFGVRAHSKVPKGTRIQNVHLRDNGVIWLDLPQWVEGPMRDEWHRTKDFAAKYNYYQSGYFIFHRDGEQIEVIVNLDYNTSRPLSFDQHHLIRFSINAKRITVGKRKFPTKVTELPDGTTLDRLREDQNLSWQEISIPSYLLTCEGEKLSEAVEDWMSKSVAISST